MKKITLLAAVAIAFTFASCKKDRTCTCTSTSTSPGSTAQTTTTVYKKSRKKDARLFCQSTVQTTVRDNNTTVYTDDCKLK